MNLGDLASWMEDELGRSPMVDRRGKVAEVVGTVVRATGLDAQLGELCRLLDARGGTLQMAEVIGFSRGQTLLSPFGPLQGVMAGRTAVVASGEILSVPVGDALLGRVVDSLGRPLDGGARLDGAPRRPVFAEPPNPMTRRLIEEVMPTGVKAIDGLITLGEGQRLGIFAPAGVGKSTLMGMLARGTACDVNVIALIGERGREVREFIELILGTEGMARSVVVCATSDRSAIERAKAAHAATSIAEYFRDRGQRVLLMMDSLTRFARAQREIGLAAGEAPARRGFPPSVFAEIPRLLERAGMGEQGSITALYTVLAEDESGSDPIAEEVRGILDGHLILSRRIAARHQYPAIDVLGSLSRVMSQIAESGHQQAASRLRQLLAKHDDLEMLLQMGEYAPGADALADEAVKRHPALMQFLSQDTADSWAMDDTLAALREAGVMSAAELRGMALLQRVSERRVRQLELAAAEAARCQRQRGDEAGAAQAAEEAAEAERQARLQRFGGLGQEGGIDPAHAAALLRCIDEQQAACRAAAQAHAAAQAALQRAVQKRQATVQQQQAAQARAKQVDERHARLRTALDQADQDAQDEETADAHRPREP